MKRKIVGIAICFVALCLKAGAQKLGIELDGGLQGTHFAVKDGSSRILPGGSLGLRYTVGLTRSLDLLTGISGGIYRTQVSLPNGVAFSSYQVDDAGSAFQYSVKATGYEEMQRFFAAGVPLLLHYHTSQDQLQWYFDAGGKVFLPFSSNIQVSTQQLVISGYYPDNNLVISNLPQHGFGTMKDWKANTTTQLKPSAALSAATGVGFRMNPNTRLYVGIYVDYGLTTLKEKNDSLPLVAYSPAGLNVAKPGSVLNNRDAGKLSLLSFGLQLRVTFGSAKPKASRSRTKKVPEQQAPKDSITDEEYVMLERSMVFDNVGDTTLPDVQRKHLDEVAEIMKRHQRMNISLVGHVCSSDMEKEDNRIGLARTEYVAHYLQSLGIDPRRMEISPVVENHAFEPLDPLANYQHRKVSVTVK